MTEQLLMFGADRTRSLWARVSLRNALAYRKLSDVVRDPARGFRKGRLVGARRWSRPRWHYEVGMDPTAVRPLVACGLIVEDGDDLLLPALEVSPEFARIQSWRGALGARARWGNRRKAGDRAPDRAPDRLLYAKPAQSFETDPPDALPHEWPLQRSAGEASPPCDPPGPDLFSGHDRGAATTTTPSIEAASPAGGGGGAARVPDPEASKEWEADRRPENAGFRRWLEIYPNKRRPAAALAIWRGLKMSPAGEAAALEFTRAKVRSGREFTRDGGAWARQPGKFLAEVWAPELERQRARQRKAAAAPPPPPPPPAAAGPPPGGWRQYAREHVAGAPF